MTRFGTSAAIATLALVTMMPAGAIAQEATGTITGHITNEFTGQVTVNLWTTAGASAGQVLSDSAGNYAFSDVTPGTYKLQFGFQERWQWAYQKLGFSAAESFTVSAGASTVVDETLLAEGVVEVVATDAVTGLPVDNYCAALWDHMLGQCGAVNGVMRLENFESGPRTVYLRDPDGLHARTRIDNVSVVLGQVTRLEVSLRPTAAIATTVVDSQTGQPVSDVCVAALPLVFHELDEETCRWDTNYTDENGQILLGELDTREYTLLAVPNNGIHGAQWVGRHGGTGSQYTALKINATAGVLSTVADIRLDGRASITGVVNDATTAAPLPGSTGCASVLPGTVYGLPKVCGSYPESSYLLSNLGPYAWPVQFTHAYSYAYSYGNSWSGGVTDRKLATLIQASTGTPTVANGTIGEVGPKIRIDARYPDGQRYEGYFAYTVYNARTGDTVVSNSLHYSWEIGGVPAQNVKIKYSIGYPHGFMWAGGTDFASAKTIKLTDTGVVTVRVVVPW